MYRYIHKKDLNEYEKEHQRLSYQNLFYHDDSVILCNNIANDEDLELVNGSDYNEEHEEYEEIYQYYIIDDDTARRLIDNTNEIIYHHNSLDLYVLGVTHYGTSWDYVLTEFKLKETDDNGWYVACKGDSE